MGICYNKKKNIIEPIKHQPSNNVTSSLQNAETVFSKKKLAQPEEKFEDMPEWEGERYKGLGIKRMKGYKCNLKINELTKLREDFWLSHQQNRQQWKIIHQACVYDHIKAEDYLNKNNMKTLNGCINCCVDQSGNVYCVPNYCINDPYFELELLPKDNNHNSEIEIKLFDLINQKNLLISVNENITGAELKQKYSEMHNIELSKNKIRLLFGGGLIKDDETLYQHKVKNGFSIQVCVTSIE